VPGASLVASGSTVSQIELQLPRCTKPLRLLLERAVFGASDTSESLAVQFTDCDLEPLAASRVAFKATAAFRAGHWAACQPRESRFFLGTPLAKMWGTRHDNQQKHTQSRPTASLVAAYSSAAAAAGMAPLLHTLTLRACFKIIFLLPSLMYFPVLSGGFSVPQNRAPACCAAARVGKR
jgi:hypothetical protein